MQTLLAVLVVPFMLLNILGWIVALIWLMVLGEWSHIGWGILVAVIMPFAFSLASLPGMAFTAGFAYFAERDLRVPSIFFALLSSVYTHVLVMAWVFIVFFHYARSASADNYIPLLLWGYSVAMGPLSYMAKHEADNPFTSLLLFLAQIAYIALVVCLVIRAEMVSAIVFLAALIAMSTLFAMVVGISSMPPRRIKEVG